MGYFDGLADAIFKKDTEQKTVFYPWGVLGSGLIIENEEQKKRVRSIIKRMYIIMLPTIIILQLTVGLWANAALLPLYLIWYFLWAKKLSKTLNKSEEKLKLSEAYRNSAKSHNLAMLLVLELACFTFLGLAVLLIMKNGLVWQGVVSIVLFGLSSIAIGYMIVVKVKSEKNIS